MTVPLEVGGDAQHQPGVLQGDRLHVAKPGFDGYGGHAGLHQAFYFFPYVASRSHGRKPPKQKYRNLKIIPKKGETGKGF